MRALRIAITCLLLTACGQTAIPHQEGEKAGLRVTEWMLPETLFSAQPDLVESSDARLLLSWIENKSDDHALKLSEFDGKAWGTPRTVARGGDWIVNWADTPHVVASGDMWWAHWLRESAAGGYDVVLSRSGDRGANWSAPVSVNTDGKAGEHGFVSMWPEATGALGIAWLDGRNAGREGHGGHEGHGGAMTLRTAVFDASLQRSDERELDAMTCDCCQTDAALTARGPLLVWRDRDENEIRDIVVSRRDGTSWTSSHKVHDDGWKMPACPVNGPAIAARREHAWVAWYTAADDVPRVRMAFSKDAGDTFAAPVEVDAGPAVQGRVAVAAGDDAVWLAWIREDAQGQSLQLARYAPDLSGEIARSTVARMQGRGRPTGFPQMVAEGSDVRLVWVDIVEGAPRLFGAEVRAK